MPQPPAVAYLPPSGSPARAASARVRQPSGLVFTELLDQLKRSPLKIEKVDRNRGLIIATYSGNPEQHVDCGWIVQYGPQGLSKIRGSRDQAVFDGVPTGSGSNLRRDLKLNARTAIQVRPVGVYTDVLVDSTYVLTKIVRAESTSGQERGRRHEVISFKTGGRGKFEVGTRCQPTGKLEFMALGAWPGSAIVATTPGSERSLAVVDEAGLDCSGADRAYCRALEITAPYREANAQRMLGLRLDISGSDGVLYDGDVLTLDISFPTYDSYLHVSYIDRRGRVGHVIPGNDQLWPAHAAHYVQETAYEIGEPYGVEAILAIASEQPLFPASRPRFEQAATYLSALRQALTNLQAGNPETRIAANLMLVQTAPRAASISGSARGYANLAPDDHLVDHRVYTEG